MEYQFYKFRAIDRPLTRDEQRELREISTRARITSREFVNTYDWGDLKADPAQLLLRYFDVHVYTANWGHNCLMFRFPTSQLDARTLEPYCSDDSPTLRVDGEYLSLEFNTPEDCESEEYLNAEDDSFEELIELREDILNGDLRALYLAWLLNVGEYGPQDTIEPPVPPGLQELPDSLWRLVEFLSIDEFVIEAAAQASEPLRPKSAKSKQVGPGKLADWVINKPGPEKDTLLREFLSGEEDAEDIRLRLQDQFRKETLTKAPPSSQFAAKPGRTIAELRGLRDRLEEIALRAEEEEQAEQEAAEAREAAEERMKYLMELKKKKRKAWGSVRNFINSKTPKSYQDAVELLKDLNELSILQGQSGSFNALVQDLRIQHAKKSAFLERLTAAGLP